jgi:hypothetical protein
MLKLDNHIPNDELTQAFQRHLELPDNNRIVFSGQFGIGKSTFLRKFFENNKKQKIIHLYPVNYSISSNEDILELLKYDILYELLANYKIATEEFNFSDTDIASWFIQNHSIDVMTTIVEFLPTIGKPLSAILKTLKELAPKFEQFKKDVKKGELDAIGVLLSKVESKEGGIYRRDFYTDFINRKLAEIKATEADNETILIIDDLDRIDPEHIFRLFNVFAAHFDVTNSNNENKFGFDRVIFVCDIENIRKIFSHRYGGDVDFNGYIDKFYSTKIFEVNNRLALENIIEKADSVRGGSTTTKFILDILITMIDAKVINFRNVNKLSHREVVLEYKENYHKSSKFHELYFTEVAAVLTLICGNSTALIKKLEECYEKFLTLKIPPISEDRAAMKKYILIYLLPVVGSGQHGFVIARPQSFAASDINKNSSQGSFRYHLQRDSQSKYISELDEDNLATNFEPLIPLIWGLIIEATKILQGKGVIN